MGAASPSGVAYSSLARCGTLKLTLQPDFRALPHSHQNSPFLIFYLLKFFHNTLLAFWPILNILITKPSFLKTPFWASCFFQAFQLKEKRYSSPIKKGYQHPSTFQELTLYFIWYHLCGNNIALPTLTALGALRVELCCVREIKWLEPNKKQPHVGQSVPIGPLTDHISKPGALLKGI